MSDIIDLVQGSDETLKFELFEDVEETLPYDLTDATVTITAGSGVAPTPAITDAANGIVEVSFTDTQTEAMKRDRKYSFRLKFTWPSGTDLVTPDVDVRAI